jgi:ribonuclease E
MERIGTRAPEDRAKTAPSMPDTPLIAMHVDDEADNVVEEDEVAEDEAETTQASQPETQPANGEGGRKRRRRRRRGRDRNQPQPGQPNPAPASLQSSETHDAADAEGDDEDDDHTEGQPGEHAEQQQGAAPNGEGGVRKRRRRRRRGRRGGQREGGPNYVGSGDGLEGVPVDASVQDGDSSVATGDASDTSVISPVLNAPSAPLWSLSSETHDHAREEPARRIDMQIPASVADKTVDAAPALAAEAVRAQISDVEEPRADAPQTPARKGWWQRPFRRE